MFLEERDKEETTTKSIPTEEYFQISMIDIQIPWGVNISREILFLEIASMPHVSLE